eukprot:TRINITY_DN12430_c0_g1_i1.p1 TRINITY_DN12430_c0_g1~~TRINITY_DN12430_c0_g1_i1.p1  ORF type:complete len:615 (+),score=106.18 TRINITY_DN12430_c0_g1_i1:2-1846(+)
MYSVSTMDIESLFPGVVLLHSFLTKRQQILMVQDVQKSREYNRPVSSQYPGSNYTKIVSFHTKAQADIVPSSFQTISSEATALAHTVDDSIPEEHQGIYCTATMYDSIYGKLGAHCDNISGWVVLFSLGCSAEYFVKMPRKNRKRFTFKSGDVLIYNGSSGLKVRKSIEKINTGSCPSFLPFSVSDKHIDLQFRSKSNTTVRRNIRTVPIIKKSKKVVQSAVAIIPPERFWGPIQDIRRDYDKAYQRWMPHINLLYPFIPDTKFISIKEKLTEALYEIPSFEMGLNNFSHFTFRNGDCSLHLTPETKANSLNKLQSLLGDLFPHCTELSNKGENGYNGHLTVGQFNINDPTMESFQKDWSPINFTVDKIYLISRTGDSPFEVKEEIELGPKFGEINPNEILVEPHWNDEPIYEDISEDETSSYSEEESDSGNDTFMPSSVYSRPNSRVDLSGTYHHDLITKKVKTWLKKMSKKQQNLPKLSSKLASAIKQFCSYRILVIQVEYILFILESNEIISISGDIFRLNDDFDDQRRISDDPELDPIQNETVERCFQWIISNKYLPSTVEGLKNSIRQLCSVKMQVDPRIIMNRLQQDKFVEINAYSEKMEYFPKKSDA